MNSQWLSSHWKGLTQVIPSGRRENQSFASFQTLIILPPQVLIEESEGLNLNSQGDERSDSLCKRTHHQHRERSAQQSSNALIPDSFQTKNCAKIFQPWHSLYYRNFLALELLYSKSKSESTINKTVYIILILITYHKF